MALRDVFFIKPLAGLLAIALLSGCQAGPTDQTASNSDRVEGRGGDTQNWYDKLPRAEWAQYERLLPDTAWFEVYRIRPGVTAIYEPGQFEEVISFLIEGEDNAVLFDTGLGIGDMAGLINRLTDKPVRVINSHSHYDHVGGNAGFDTIWGPDTDYGRGHAKGRPHSEMAEHISPAWLGNVALPGGFDPKTYAIEPYDLDAALTDGQIIDLGGRTLEILLIPGHAPDALAVLDRDNGDLYVGDTFYLAPLYAHLEGSDPAAYQAAATRLAALAPDLNDVMTAHNVPIVSPDYLIQLRDGFTAIDSGTLSGTPTDGAVEYDLGDFSLILPRP